MKRFGGILPVAVLALGGCVNSDCANIFNGPYAGKPQHKAIAQGGGQCYYVWNRNSEDVAKRDAVRNCSRTGSSECRVVAVNGSYTSMTIAESREIMDTLNQIVTVGAAVATGYMAGRTGMTPYVPGTTSLDGNRSSPGPSMNCSVEEQRLRAEMQAIQSRMRGGSEGICSVARQSVGIFERLAAHHRRCASVMPGAHAQAAAYDRQAEAARQTARSSCSAS